MKRYPIIALIDLGLALAPGYFISAQISDFLGITTYVEIPVELPQYIAIFDGILAFIGLLLRRPGADRAAVS